MVDDGKGVQQGDCSQGAFEVRELIRVAGTGNLGSGSSKGKEGVGPTVFNSTLGTQSDGSASPLVLDRRLLVQRQMITNATGLKKK